MPSLQSRSSEPINSRLETTSRPISSRPAGSGNATDSTPSSSPVPPIPSATRTSLLASTVRPPVSFKPFLNPTPRSAWAQYRHRGNPGGMPLHQRITPEQLRSRSYRLGCGEGVLRRGRYQHGSNEFQVSSCQFLHQAGHHDAVHRQFQPQSIQRRLQAQLILGLLEQGARQAGCSLTWPSRSRFSSSMLLSLMERRRGTSLFFNYVATVSDSSGQSMSSTGNSRRAKG